MPKILTKEYLSEFREAISTHFGIQNEYDSDEILEDILLLRMKESNSSSPESYFQRLSFDPSEQTALAEFVSVGETYFFRHEDHFSALVNKIFPEMFQKNQGKNSLNILSLGCSSGEEAYSIAILIDKFGLFKNWDIKVIGIDVCRSSIEKARKGSYRSWSFRNVDKRIIDENFNESGNFYTIRHKIRNMVSFVEMNIVKDNEQFWYKDQFDIIFSRNILMYFRNKLVKEIIDNKISNALKEQGYLFLSPSETLRGLSNSYHLIHTDNIFYYQKKSLEELKNTSEYEKYFTHLVRSYKDIYFSNTSKNEETLSSYADVKNEEWFNQISESSRKIQEILQQTTLMAPHKNEPNLSKNSYEQAKKLFLEEKFTESFDLLSRSSQAGVNELVLLSLILVNKHSFSEAEDLCNQILEKFELEADAHYIKAICNEYKGNIAVAIEHNEYAVYLDSTFAMPYLHLGLLYKKSKKFELAEANLRKAVKLFREENESRLGLFGGGFSRETLIMRCENEIMRGEVKYVAG